MIHYAQVVYKDGTVLSKDIKDISTELDVSLPVIRRYLKGFKGYIVRNAMEEHGIRAITEAGTELIFDRKVDINKLPIKVCYNIDDDSTEENLLKSYFCPSGDFRYILELPDDFSFKINGVVYIKCRDCGNLIVGDNGHVFSYQKYVTTLSEVGSSSGRNHYLRACIYYKGDKLTTTIQRIVAYAFHRLDGLRYTGIDIDHINNNRQDNRLVNLQAITHKENIKKRDRNGNWRDAKVDQYDKNGNFIQTFNSYQGAARAVGGAASNIYTAAKKGTGKRGNLVTVYGYHWRPHN